MRSPVGIALLFSLLLLGWLFSRPIQELLAGHEPPAIPAPVASTGPVSPQMTVRVVESVARPIAPEIVVNGHTEAVRTVQLKAETDGRVVETPWRASSGDRGRWGKRQRSRVRWSRRVP